MILLKVGGKRSTSFEARNLLPLASSPPKEDDPQTSDTFSMASII
jgi:hypothetical protein